MTEQTIQQKLAKQLYDELNRDYKPNKKKPELGEFMTLKVYYGKAKVEFSVGWYDVFEVTFKPKTVGVVYTKTNPNTKEKKTVSKQYPLDQKNLLDTILALYVKDCK